MKIKDKWTDKSLIWNKLSTSKTGGKTILNSPTKKMAYLFFPF